MKLVQLHGLLADETRLRILHLLLQGPLCVCHFQTVLGAPQVKISKHLASLRQRGLVTSRRHKNWMIYELASNLPEKISIQLKAIKLAAAEEAVLQRDLKRLARISSEAGEIVSACCS